MLGYHAERGGGDVGDQDLVLLYRQLQPGLEIVLNPLVDNPDRLRLDNPRLLEGPEQLAHGLGSVLDQEHDQLALLLRHNLGLLHKGGGVAAGGGRCGRSRRRFRLNVEVEFGLELAKLVLHHALVVAAVALDRSLVIGAGVLGIYNTVQHNTSIQRENRNQGT